MAKLIWIIPFEGYSLKSVFGSLLASLDVWAKGKGLDAAFVLADDAAKACDEAWCVTYVDLGVDLTETARAQALLAQNAKKPVLAIRARKDGTIDSIDAYVPVVSDAEQLAIAKARIAELEAKPGKGAKSES